LCTDERVKGAVKKSETAGGTNTGCHFDTLQFHILSNGGHQTTMVEQVILDLVLTRIFWSIGPEVHGIGVQLSVAWIGIKARTVLAIGPVQIPLLSVINAKL